MQISEAIDGKKTYAVAALFAVVAFAKFSGWITTDVAAALENALLASGAVTLRMAIAKVGNPINGPVAVPLRLVQQATSQAPQKDWTTTLIVAIAAALAGSRYEGTKPAPEPIVIEIDRTTEAPLMPSLPSVKPQPPLIERQKTSEPLRFMAGVYSFTNVVHASPKLSGPSEVKPGELIEIVSDAPDDAAVMWDAVEPLTLDFRTYNSDRVFVCAAGCRGGKVVVTCITIQLVSGKIKANKIRHSITIVEPIPDVPPTASLEATPATLAKGQSALLSWNTDRAASVKLDGAPVTATGSIKITPDKTTSYTLTATSGATTATAQRLVTVTDLPPPPFPAQGLSVLIIEADAGKRTFQTGTTLADPVLRKYLNEKCVIGPDGKTPEWRIYDEKTDITNAEPNWKSAMALPRIGHPWIVISNGQSGYEGLLPATAADVLKLLKKYGGE